MSKYEGRFISSAKPNVSTASASGVWTAEEVIRYEREGIWPESGEVDPFFNQTVLLLKGDGNQGATNLYNPGPTKYLAFSDNSVNNFPITVNGDAYGTNISPYQANYSYFFDGNGDYLEIADNEAFEIGGGNFTFECWVYLTGYSAAYTGSNYAASLMNKDAPGARAYTIQIGGTASSWTTIGMTIFSGNSTFLGTSGSFNFNLFTWYHVAVVRNGTTLTFYVDGVSVGSGTNSTVSQNVSSNVQIGSESPGYIAEGYGYYFPGYISNWRFVKGSAIYTGNFTPSTTPLTAVSGTSLLTCKSNRILDNSTNNFTITRNGDVRVSHFQPFILAADDNGSGYFDGTGDWITSSGGVDSAVGTSTFSFEAWVYWSSFASQFNTIFSTRPSNTNNADAFTVGVQNTGVVYIYSNGDIVTRNAPWVNGQWNHIVVTRDGTTVRLFINGILRQTGTNSQNFSRQPWSVAANVDGTETSAGYITGVRLIKGSIPAEYQTASTTLNTQVFLPPTAPPTAITNTSILALQYNGTVRNVGFIDSGPNYFPITRVGNTTQGTFSPFSAEPGKWSNYFDGTGDYLSFASNSVFNLSGQYTLEFWINASSSLDFAAFFATAGGLQFSLNAAGNISIAQQNIAFELQSTTPLPYNSWNHLAATRDSSNVTRIFLNGNQIASATITTNYPASTTYINYNPGASSNHFTGSVSNLRLIKGTALYTSNFIPSTTPLTAIANTVLLTCQSNRFVDNSTNAFAITRNGDVRVTAFSPFAPITAYSPNVNGGSVYFDGSGDSIVLQHSPNLTPTGDFCIEFWAYPLANPAVAEWYAKGAGIQIYSASGLWYAAFSASNNSTYFINTSFGSLILNAWQHIAVTRSGNTYRGFVNGVPTTLVTSSSSPNTGTDVLRIGDYSTSTIYPVTGYVSSCRFVNGSAVYTDVFTLPTAPLTVIANTQLLLNFTNAGILDQTGKNVLETVGNAQVDTNIKKYNIGSMKFDGTGDYLIIPRSQEFAFGTGNFTVEFWFYTTNVSTRQDPLSVYTASTGFGIALSYDNTTDVIFYNGNTVLINTVGGQWLGNVWNHLAVSRSGTSLRMFLNGVQIGSATDSTNFTIASNLYVGIAGNVTLPFTGYIDDLRITKGVARYTTTFTPPQLTLPNR